MLAISSGLAGRSVAARLERSISVCCDHAIRRFHSLGVIFWFDYICNVFAFSNSTGTNIQTNEEVAIKLVSVPNLLLHPFV